MKLYHFENFIFVFFYIFTEIIIFKTWFAVIILTFESAWVHMLRTYKLSFEILATFRKNWATYFNILVTLVTSTLAE
jgi:hypothetical protein